jgi:hypothetical protein
MLNVIASVVATFASVLVSFIKGPVTLVVGVAFTVFMLASPAEAAVIQCNVYDCSMLAQSFPEWWDLLVWHKKAAVILFFSGLIIGNFLMWHDRKVTAERIKAEQQEWLKKYHS